MIWGIWRSWQAVWINPWGWTLLLLGLFFISSIRWRVKVLPWALGYILFTSIGFSYRADNFSIAPITMSSILAMFSFLVFCTLPDPKKFTYQRILTWVGLLGVPLAIMAFFDHSRPDSAYIMPVLWNRSVGGSFLVLALAPTGLFWVGGIIAIILGRSTPIVVFAAYWAARRCSVIRSVICAWAIVLFFYLKGIPDGTGRFEFWKLYWHYWCGLPAQVKLFGMHLGTTAAHLPSEQAIQGIGPGGQYFIWLHNDFYQALTELGWIGFSLCLIAGLEIFRRCSREQKAMGIALAASMATNYPFHWMPEAFLFWIWIKGNAVNIGA